MYIYLMKLTWLKSNVILLHKLIYSHPYLNESETLLQKGAMENKSSKPLHQCYNISGFPSNQQKRVSERTLVKVRGQGHSARSKSTGLLQVWENPDTVYREDAVYCLGHAAEGGAGHAGLRLRLLPPRTFCGGHDLSIYVSYFFLIILFVFCLSCSFKSGNGKIVWKIISLKKLVIQLISYMMTSIITTFTIRSHVIGKISTSWLVICSMSWNFRFVHFYLYFWNDCTCIPFILYIFVKDVY